VTRATGEMLDLAPVMLCHRDGERNQDDGVQRHRRRLGTGFARSSQHFVDATDSSGTAAAMTPAEATDVLRLCFAVYEAGATRLPVDPRGITGTVSPPGWGDW